LTRRNEAIGDAEIDAFRKKNQMIRQFCESRGAQKSNLDPPQKEMPLLAKIQKPFQRLILTSDRKSVLATAISSSNSKFVFHRNCSVRDDRRFVADTELRKGGHRTE
jgi:hypothetical protein